MLWPTSDEARMSSLRPSELIDSWDGVSADVKGRGRQDLQEN